MVLWQMKSRSLGFERIGGERGGGQWRRIQEQEQEEEEKEVTNLVELYIEMEEGDKMKWRKTGAEKRNR